MAEHSFGQWLKKRRKALDLTQQELARKTGCAKITIQKIEAEERRPSKVTAERLAVSLGIPAHARGTFVYLARAGIQPNHINSRSETVSTNGEHTTLDWHHIITGLELIRRGNFAFHLPAQPPGSSAAIVVDTFNSLVLHLSQVTAELTRIVREVGTDSRLGCQAEIPDVEGRWLELQYDINQMATILTLQLRRIANTTGALAKGAEAPRLVLDGRGEMRGIQEAINMVADRVQPTAHSDLHNLPKL